MQSEAELISSFFRNFPNKYKEIFIDGSEVFCLCCHLPMIMSIIESRYIEFKCKQMTLSFLDIYDAIYTLYLKDKFGIIQASISLIENSFHIYPQFMKYDLSYLNIDSESTIDSLLSKIENIVFFS